MQKPRWAPVEVWASAASLSWENIAERESPIESEVSRDLQVPSFGQHILALAHRAGNIFVGELVEVRISELEGISEIT